MTTNIDRAADVIDRWTKAGGELNSHVGSPHSVAQALADAGLLMPDLPPADEGEWEEGHSVISLDDEGFILLSIDSRATHPGRARRIAYKILAAADHAEQEHTDV